MTKKAWLCGALAIFVGMACAQTKQEAPKVDPKKYPAKSSPTRALLRDAIAPLPIEIGECDLTSPGKNCKIQVRVVGDDCKKLKAKPDVAKITAKLSGPPSKLIWEAQDGWVFDEKAGIGFKSPDAAKVFTNCARAPAPDTNVFICDNSGTSGYYAYGITVTKGKSTCTFDPGAWNTPVP